MLSLQQRFPVESAINEIFIRKLRNRHVKVEHSMNFENLHETLTQFIKVQTGQSELFIENLQRLSGGASKEQFTFDLIRKSYNSDAPTTQRLMLRMDPTESVVETHRLREWQMLRAMQGEVPVPEVFWLDLEGEYLGQPAIVAGFLEGTVRPESKEDKMSGIGMYFEPYLRENLKGQFVEILAKIHRVNWREKDLSAFDVPQSNSTQANEWALNQLERAWQEDTTHAHPIMEQAAVWLRENMPVVENPVIIHGDYRSGNFMYDNNLNINAIFDWELAYLGDYHDDVAWASLSIFGGPDEQGNPLAGSLLPIEEFLERYEAASGFPVDRKRLFYYQLFSYYKMAVFTAATSLRVVYSKKTHLDAMMNFASGIGYICISELNRMLEQT
ncbi:MAG: phosphotransferase family protein [Porticoccaceae bacterium]|nr:phosphotransferase family protein [Porticoccaceae bacterium]